jgi:hypothetical protein
MDIDVNHPEHPANTQPGLHESELNILDRDNTNGLGTLASFFGIGLFMGGVDVMGEALANADIVGEMPAGPVTTGLEVNTPAPQPAPNVAPQDPGMGMGMGMHPNMLGPK